MRLHLYTPQDNMVILEAHTIFHSISIMSRIYMISTDDDLLFQPFTKYKLKKEKEFRDVSFSNWIIRGLQKILRLLIAVHKHYAFCI